MFIWAGTSIVGHGVDHQFWIKSPFEAVISPPYYLWNPFISFTLSSWDNGATFGRKIVLWKYVDILTFSSLIPDRIDSIFLFTAADPVRSLFPVLMNIPTKHLEQWNYSYFKVNVARSSAPVGLPMIEFWKYLVYPVHHQNIYKLCFYLSIVHCAMLSACCYICMSLWK